MAFHLNRAFEHDPDFYILHDLRLVDDEQSEHNGSARVAQIDHLVLHRWGAFLIESKSAFGEVVVEPDGHGGQSWHRKTPRGVQGFRCPIQQTRLQGEQLRTILQRHCTMLVGRVPVGFRTLVKAINGTDQRGFLSMPIQSVIAFGESAVIRRQNGWQEPKGKFKCFVLKDDQVVDRIREEYRRHKAGSILIGPPKGEYGLWAINEFELKAVAEFLVEQHQGRGVDAAARVTAAPQPGSPGDAPTCRACTGITLTARWGRYGYYWHCVTCGASITMPTTCSECNAIGHRGIPVRISKNGPCYNRICDDCGHTERIWTEPPTTTASS
jgi:hypothetical protein